MSAEQEPLQVGDRIRLTASAGAPDGVLREACADRLLRVQRTEGNDPGYILVSGTRYGDQWLPAADFELVSRREPTPAEVIHRARDVLAKWRVLYTNPAWQVLERADGLIAVADSEQVTVADAVAPEDAALIVGTAGNPDLLDAIDAVLNAALVFNRDDGLRIHGRHLAAAIIAADDRMSR